MITYGNLREWDPEGLTSASTALRADLHVLERARDAVEAQTVPDSWAGIARVFAVARQSALVGTMDHHIEGARAFERAIFTAQAQVATITTLVVDLDHDARSQEFEIGPDGSVTDVSAPMSFDSIRAAEAHSAGRVLLRDALAERVESVVDQAYEVDAALVHARPDGSFSADGPQGVADPEVERQWSGMSEDERRATLEEMAETLADDYGLDDFEIRYEDLEDEDGDGADDDPQTNSHGSWSDDDRVLRIDVNDLDDPAIINTMAHEVRHAGQHENVRDADPGLIDQALIDAGLKDDPFDPPPGVDREQVEDWRDNFDDYQRAEDDFDDYWNQPVEADARESGEDYLDDLTGEDLEEHREAAG